MAINGISCAWRIANYQYLKSNAQLDTLLQHLHNAHTTVKSASNASSAATLTEIGDIDWFFGASTCKPPRSCCSSKYPVGVTCFLFLWLGCSSAAEDAFELTLEVVQPLS